MSQKNIDLKLSAKIIDANEFGALLRAARKDQKITLEKIIIFN